MVPSLEDYLELSDSKLKELAHLHQRYYLCYHNLRYYSTLKNENSKHTKKGVTQLSSDYENEKVRHMKAK
jgi:hypothetical protein